MTQAQNMIMMYIKTQFIDNAISTTPIGDSTIEIKDNTGATMRFTCNIYGDIMDADTKEIIAEADTPHSLQGIGNKMPTKWNNSYKYFTKGGRTMTSERPNHRPPKERTIIETDLDRDFFTIYEVADLLNFHHQTVRNMIKTGELPAKKYGKEWRIRKQDLEKFTTPM